MTRDVLLQRLAGLIGTESLAHTLNPQRKKFDERVAAKTVRTQVADALRKLSELGFVDLIDKTRLWLRPALLRFAEPARGLMEQPSALEQLVARGEVLLADTSDQDESAADDEEPAP